MTFMAKHISPCQESKVYLLGFELKILFHHIGLFNHFIAALDLYFRFKVPICSGFIMIWIFINR